MWTWQHPPVSPGCCFNLTKLLLHVKANHMQIAFLSVTLVGPSLRSSAPRVREGFSLLAVALARHESAHQSLPLRSCAIWCANKHEVSCILLCNGWSGLGFAFSLGLKYSHTCRLLIQVSCQNNRTSNSKSNTVPTEVPKLQAPKTSCYLRGFAACVGSGAIRWISQKE